MRRSPSLERAETRSAASPGVDARGRLDLKGTAGFLVADARGRLVGRAEGPMYGVSEDMPDALSVRFSLLRWRRRLVPADAIETIDDRTKVIGLRIERTAVRAFL